MEGRVDDDCQNNSAGGTDQEALRVNCDQCEGYGGEDDDSDNDTCLSHRLGFDFEGEFHYQGEQREGGRKKRA